MFAVMRCSSGMELTKKIVLTGGMAGFPERTMERGNPENP